MKLHENEVKPGEGVMPNGKPAVTSSGKLLGFNHIYDRTAHPDAGPYMTRAWLGRLRLHIFWRGDADPDCHDHPWDFWTFPLRPYVEEVVRKPSGLWFSPGEDEGQPEGWDTEYRTYRQVVPAWRWTFRPATHTHRVLGPWDGEWELDWHSDDLSKPSVKPGTIVTLVWRSKPSRSWGFLRNRDGNWCWTDWREYVFAGGKDAPCGEDE